SEKAMIFYHVSANCADQRLVPFGSIGAMLPQVTIFSDRGFYTTDANITIGATGGLSAREILFAGDNSDAIGACVPMGPQTVLVGVAQTIDIASLVLQAPFVIE